MTSVITTPENKNFKEPTTVNLTDEMAAHWVNKGLATFADGKQSPKETTSKTKKTK